MTEEQAAQLISAVSDLAVRVSAVGTAVVVCRVWLEVCACLLAVLIVFAASRRS